MKKQTNNVEMNKSVQLEMDNLPEKDAGNVLLSVNNEEVKNNNLQQKQEETTIEKNENEKKILEDSEQTVSKQKSRKSKITSLIFFIINIVVVACILYFQLKKEQITSIGDLLSNLKVGYTLLSLLVFVLINVCNGMIIYNYIKSNTGRKRFTLALQTQFIGRYYDNITPLGSGGQPFQIFYLNKRGLRASDSLSVTMGKYIISQVSWMIISVIAMIIAGVKGILFKNPVVGIACLIGFLLNLFLVVLIIILSVSKKLGKKMVVKGLKLLEKLRIVKNYEKQYIRVMNVVNDYQTTMRQVTSNIKQFILNICFGIMSFLLNYSLPFLIYCSFFGFNASVFLDTVLLTLIIELAASFIPLPGGTGMSELSFTAVFAPFFGTNVFWALLMWRFLGYYLYLVLGIIFISYNYCVGDKKYKWLKRKWELEAESNRFREEQYKNYKKKANKIKSKNNRLN